MEDGLAFDGADTDDVVCGVFFREGRVLDVCVATRGPLEAEGFTEV